MLERLVLTYNSWLYGLYAHCRYRPCTRSVFALTACSWYTAFTAINVMILTPWRNLVDLMTYSVYCNCNLSPRWTSVVTTLDTWFRDAYVWYGLALTTGFHLNGTIYELVRDCWSSWGTVVICSTIRLMSCFNNT